MDTTTISRAFGQAAAILVGSAIALAPIAAHASPAGTLQAVEAIARAPAGGSDPRQQVPTGPDIANSARVALREAVEAHRSAIAPGTVAPTRRQLIEADRPVLHDRDPAATPPACGARTQSRDAPNPHVERYGPIDPR